jgi:hypothetical protein
MKPSPRSPIINPSKDPCSIFVGCSFFLADY